MDEVRRRNRWNDICGREKRVNSLEKRAQTRFVHHELDMKWLRRKYGTPEVERELSTIYILLRNQILWIEINQ